MTYGLWNMLTNGRPIHYLVHCLWISTTFKFIVHKLDWSEDVFTIQEVICFV